MKSKEKPSNFTAEKTNKLYINQMIKANIFINHADSVNSC